MSENSIKPTEKKPKARHGTYPSYIIGFVLSLIFTLIPYYLVVNKTLTGKLLIIVIMAFAVSQLLIQVIFFLHLGREKNPRWNTGFLAATVGAIITVTGASVWIMYHLQANMPAMETIQKLADDESIGQVSGVKTGACDSTNTNHQVIIKDGIASPHRTVAHLCDTLTFTNDDKPTREIAFGAHPHHTAYAGYIEDTLYKGRSWTITLSQKGTYRFHDHDHAETNGVFTVSP